MGGIGCSLSLFSRQKTNNMKTIIKIQNREVGNYETTEVRVKNSLKLVPREGERIAVGGKGYDVKSVFYDFDERKIIITVL